MQFETRAKRKFDPTITLDSWGVGGILSAEDQVLWPWLQHFEKRKCSRTLRGELEERNIVTYMSTVWAYTCSLPKSTKQHQSCQRAYICYQVHPTLHCLLSRVPRTIS